MDFNKFYLDACNEIKDLRAKLQYLLSNFIISEEGLFTFPDGDTWDCKKKEEKECS